MELRVEHIGDATLYLGDCREIAPSLDADVVISDPPFSIPHNYQHQKGRKLSWEWDAKITVDEIVSVFVPLLRAAHAAFIFCGLRQSTPLALALADAGLPDKMAAWVKRYPVPPAPGNHWPSAFQLAVYGVRPGAFFGDADPRRTNVFHFDALRGFNPDKNGHPTQTPLNLMIRIVGALANLGMTVVDPFMGSGTTGVAALRLGRRFIGIDIESQYFDIACKRIDQEARQGRLSI